MGGALAQHVSWRVSQFYCFLKTAVSIILTVGILDYPSSSTARDICCDFLLTTEARTREYAQVEFSLTYRLNFF